MPAGVHKEGRERKRHPSSMRYTIEQRWIKNKRRRVRRHLKQYPNDAQASRIMEGLK